MDSSSQICNARHQACCSGRRLREFARGRTQGLFCVFKVEAVGHSGFKMIRLSLFT